MNLAATIAKMKEAGMSCETIVTALELYRPDSFIPLMKHVLACNVEHRHLGEILGALIDPKELDEVEEQSEQPKYVPRTKRQYGYTGPVTPRLREDEWLPLRWRVLQRDAFVCAYCGVEGQENAKWCVDHVVPLSRGGSNNPENLVACCQPCNSSKSDRLLSEWRGRYQ